jgi:hypothetical protein
MTTTTTVVKTTLTQRLLNMLRRLSGGQSAAELLLDQAITRAYTRFKQQYPIWANSLFDEHFVRYHALPLLEKLHDGPNAVTPVELAHIWMAQIHKKTLLNPTNLPALTEVASAFLRLLNEELHGKQHSALPAPQPLAEVLATDREDVRQGDLERGAALTIFAEVLSNDSNYELDWLWLASMLPNSVEREYCLRRALDINPDNVVTQRQLERLTR